MFFKVAIRNVPGHVPKTLFTLATIDSLNNNKTKNAPHNETVILNYFGGDLISHCLSN